MPRTGGGKSERGQMGSPCYRIGNGEEQTCEEARTYVNTGGRWERERRRATAINYVYAYKTKARAFESIKDVSVAEERDEGRREVLRLCIALLFDGPIIPIHPPSPDIFPR